MGMISEIGLRKDDYLCQLEQQWNQEDHVTQTTRKYRGQKIYHFVYHELIMAARYRGFVSYQEIAKMMGLPSRGSYMGKELGIILGEISEDEISNGRPMLSALAVSVNGEPGDGFYSWAKDLGRFDDASEDRRQFWEREKQAVYEAWKVDLSD
jgi:hypothetical protein